jgi:hypothetical protein
MSEQDQGRWPVRFLTPTQFAERLHLHRNSLPRLQRKGLIPQPAVDLGPTLKRFTESQLEDVARAPRKPSKP